MFSSAPTRTVPTLFSVRADLAHHVLPLLKEQRAFPARYRDSRGEQGELDPYRRHAKG